jgi:hypothetical protein
MSSDSLLDKKPNIRQLVPCCGQDELREGERRPEDPEVWGPLLWKILYFLIYKTQTKKCFEKILSLLKNLDKALPCSICNEHVNQYLQREPLIQLLDKPHSPEDIQFVKTRIFLWIRKLQNIIRFNHKKEIYTFTLESLEEYYKTVNITHNTFRSIYSIFAFANGGVQKGITKELKEWLRILEELKIEILG